ncbi:MAG: histidine kinase, partial [Mangrovimonas sp.]|nr:histidine kinase [Mangrovimonas sp.]
HLKYLSDSLEINVEDDGIGFDEAEIEKGSGLINMKSRAELIGVHFRLSSAKDKGTKLFMKYAYRSDSKLNL